MFHSPAAIVAATLVERHSGDIEHLQVVAARVAGAAKQEGAAVRIRKKGVDRVLAHVGRKRDRVRVVAFERLARIVLGRGADVAALGVEDHRHLRMLAVDVRDQLLELVFCARGGKVGDLRLERTGEFGRRIDDVAAESKDGVAGAAQLGRKALGVRIEADAQQ